MANEMIVLAERTNLTARGALRVFDMLGIYPIVPRIQDSRGADVKPTRTPVTDPLSTLPPIVSERNWLTDDQVTNLDNGDAAFQSFSFQFKPGENAMQALQRLIAEVYPDHDPEPQLRVRWAVAGLSVST